MVLYTPQDGVATGSWTTGEQTTNNQDYTTLQATYPAGSDRPGEQRRHQGRGDRPVLASHITNFPSASALNPGVYQIRIYTSASGSHVLHRRREGHRLELVDGLPDRR